MKDYTVGKIEQLTNINHLAIPIIKQKQEPITKSQIIDCLKGYLEDYEVTEGDQSMQNVIAWFINCTPDYDESE